MCSRKGQDSVWRVGSSGSGWSGGASTGIQFGSIGRVGVVSSWANIDTEGADAAAGVAAAGGVANPVPGINEVKPSAMLTVLATMVRRRVVGDCADR